MEYSSSTQMENQTESGTQEVVTKEEINDRYITVANAADRREPSVNAMRSKDSVKKEISLAEVENTDCQELTKPDNQEPNKPTSSCTVVKKEEISDVLGTMVFPPEMSLSNLYCPSSTPEEFETNKILEVGWAQSSKDHEIRVGAFVDMPVSLVTKKVHDLPGSTFTSTSPLKATNKDPIMSTSSCSHVKKDEMNIDECSQDGDTNEAGLRKRRHVEPNTTEANNDWDGGQFTCLDCAAVFETNAAFQEHNPWSPLDIQENGHSNVMFVKRSSLPIVISPLISAFIQENGHINAISVTRRAIPVEISQSINVFIRMADYEPLAGAGEPGGAAAPPPPGASPAAPDPPPAPPAAASVKEEKNETMLKSNAADGAEDNNNKTGGTQGTQTGGTTAGTMGTQDSTAATEHTDATQTGGKKKKKKKKKAKKRKIAHFKKRGAPIFKILCMVFSFCSLLCMALAIFSGMMMVLSSSDEEDKK